MMQQGYFCIKWDEEKVVKEEGPTNYKCMKLALGHTGNRILVVLGITARE